MNEEIRRLGRHGRLSGILAWPTTHDGAGDTAVIFITAGLLHKCGPYRLYAELSRAIAKSGIPALRFDLSGIGESDAAPTGSAGSAELSAVTDVREVMDSLAVELGCSRFVLAGLCSGAEVAHRVAIADQRVSGVIALDGYIARTWKFPLYHYLPRLVSPRKWLDFARSRFGTGDARSTADRDEVDSLAFWEELNPGREELARQFRSLANREVRQLYVFSGGSGYCSYTRQFEDAFRDVDFRELLSVHFLKRADHMYILQSDRRELMRLVMRWLSAHFRELPAGAGNGTRTIPNISAAAANAALARRADERRRVATALQRRRYE